MHIRRERERRLVMAEPALHLHGVRAAPEQHRRTRVTERVEPSPRRADLLSHRPKHAPEEVAVCERRAGERREHEVLVAGPLEGEMWVCLAWSAQTRLDSEGP